jgi:hypothetical protein
MLWKSDQFGPRRPVRWPVRHLRRRRRLDYYRRVSALLSVFFMLPFNVVVDLDTGPEEPRTGRDQDQAAQAAGSHRIDDSAGKSHTDPGGAYMAPVDVRTLHNPGSDDCV